MVKEPTIYWLKENLLFVQIEDKSIILDIEERTHYLPNETAAFILQFMVAERGVGHDDLVNKLTAAYGISAVEAENAIKVILGSKSAKNHVSLVKKAVGTIPVIEKFHEPRPLEKKPAWKTPEIGPSGTVTCVGPIVIQKLSYL